MKQAIQVYSTGKGWCSEIMDATQIKSYSHARKLAPFVDSKNKLLYWVNWGKEKINKKPRVAHFKHYPNGKRTIRTIVSEEIRLRYKESKESKEHIQAKKVILQLLRNFISEKKHLPWVYKDLEISEYSMSGDFLAGAISVEKEYKISTPWGQEYRLDIAIIGEKIHSHPIVLAGIEIELTHKFDFSKALICKSLGFPLMSINIESYNLEEIDIGWAKRVLTETTQNSDDGLRCNYIYIHRMLSPIYINIPKKLNIELKHQYVIFTQKDETLLHYLKTLKLGLRLNDSQVHILKREDKNSETHTELMNAGNLAGETWKKHNSSSYILLTLERPCGELSSLYYFHLVLTSLCNSNLDCLVGYKLERGMIHEVGNDLRWIKIKIIDGVLQKNHIAPKRVSEPVIQILKYVDNAKS